MKFRINHTKSKTKHFLRRRRINTRHKAQKRTKHIKGGANLTVDYSGVPVKGQLFAKSATIVQPTIKFTGEPQTQYTLVMWDPDVPAQAQPGYAHWIAINLQGPNNIVSNELLGYKGPEPPVGTGTHRYFFGLFVQQRTIAPKQPERANFSIGNFIRENNLKEVAKVFMKVSAT